MNNLTPTQQNNVEKWVAALRSGEFEQGFGTLCKDEKYCCLGVACVTLGWERRRSPHNLCDVFIHPMYPNKFASGRPFEMEFFREMGFTYRNVFTTLVDREEYCYDLIDLNDCGQFSFPQIADIIEWYYL